MVSWDPTAYGGYAGERDRPSADLRARIGAVAPRLVVDAGCGTGSGALELARRWPQARVLAVDSSAPMLDRARAVLAGADDRAHGAHGAGRGGGVGSRVELVQADLERWAPPTPPDVLVSSAVLQWVPHHVDLLLRWGREVPPGGWLAVTVPGNFRAPSHVVPREVAAAEPFSRRYPGLADRLLGPDATGTSQGYAAVLSALGLVVDAWETTYLHVLPGEDAVLGWVRGTALRPVLDALADEPDLRDLFLARCRDLLSRAYPRRAWGTPMPFRRVFVVAHRPA